MAPNPIRLSAARGWQPIGMSEAAHGDKAARVESGAVAAGFCRATDRAHGPNAGMASRPGRCAVRGVHGNPLAMDSLEAAPILAVQGVQGVHGFIPHACTGGRRRRRTRAPLCACVSGFSMDTLDSQDSPAK